MSLTYKNFKIDVDPDGIALITWDMPGKSMNVIDESVIEELDKIVDKVIADAGINRRVGQETWDAVVRDMTGHARQTINAAVNRLEDEGLIRVGHRQIVILNSKGLDAYCTGEKS